jgi:hypothetical protein
MLAEKDRRAHDDSDSAPESQYEEDYGINRRPGGGFTSAVRMFTSTQCFLLKFCSGPIKGGRGPNREEAP